ncbi:ArnT family glycosyltransferase [Chryseobacterium populi]|uniref:Glycosyltransferase RgtA/B/C/D-like domain-containing protein n=1 Tax=Chryseobacterium populi TaxID=1144316 RepID=J2K6W6_9FLAO|nr:hypothetical protein [Chryseobacterium populi]EJL75960.1 hypothetical protein PMI13_00356 [Chryseobacterium populi]
MKSVYGAFFIVCVIIFLGSCFCYYPFISDDSLISLRYAQRFIDGKGLSWNDGDPVEGYSNFLWILGVSFLGQLGIDLIMAARILGLLCSVGIIWLIISFFAKQNIKKKYVFLGVILLVTTPCFAIWAIGGLEQPLYALLITLILTEVIRIINENSLKRIYYLSVWLGLLAITRPDGFLFTTITSVFLLFIKRNHKTDFIKITFAVAVIPSLFLLAQLIFRYTYYGELVPNTALVKVKITFYHIIRGIFYHVKAFLGTLVISSLGIYLLLVLVFKRKNAVGIFLLLNILAWTSYVSLVGGDIFPGYRHYEIVLIFLVFAVIIGLNAVKIIDFNNRKIGLGIIILLILNFIIQIKLPENQKAIQERWEFRGMQLGVRLKNTFPDKTLIAVTSAGSIPYSSGLPSIDMLGLNDYYIPRHPPVSFGMGSLAHELGDANYTMKQNPDIVIFNTGAAPSFNIGDQLKKNKIFNQNFVKVLSKERDHEYLLFFNKYGKNNGIQKTENVLKIPGYLFSHPTDTISLFSGKKLLKNVLKGNTYTLSLDGISEKKWLLKQVNSDKNVSFRTQIYYKNNRLEISVSPDENSLLESLVLEGKD